LSDRLCKISKLLEPTRFVIEVPRIVWLLVSATIRNTNVQQPWISERCESSSCYTLFPFFFASLHMQKYTNHFSTYPNWQQMDANKPNIHILGHLSTKNGRHISTTSRQAQTVQSVMQSVWPNIWATKYMTAIVQLEYAAWQQLRPHQYVHSSINQNVFQ